MGACARRRVKTRKVGFEKGNGRDKGRGKEVVWKIREIA